MFKFWKNRRKNKKETNPEDRASEKENSENFFVPKFDFSKEKLEEAMSELGIKLQSEEKNKMMDRFYSYLCLISFSMFLRKVISDPDERTAIINQMIASWENEEKKMIKKYREDLSKKDLEPIFKEQFEEIVKIREMALEESKTNIRFAFRDLCK